MAVCSERRGTRGGRLAVALVLAAVGCGGRTGLDGPERSVATDAGTGPTTDDGGVAGGRDAGGTEAGVRDGGQPDGHRACPDRDGDGFADAACGGDDCDDGNPGRFPGAFESCGTVDFDCDGEVTPCPPPATLSLGPLDGCVVRPDGSVVCWGIHPFPPTVPRDPFRPWLPPTVVRGVEGARGVDLRGDFTCAVLEEGLGCWGVSPLAPPRDGRRVYRTWEEVGIVVTTMGRYMLDASGVIRGFGATDDGPFAFDTPFPRARLAAGRLAGVGCAASRAGDAVVCARAGFSREPTPVPDLAGVVDLAVGGGHQCAVRVNGTVACWGAGREGQLGDGRTYEVAVERPVSVQGIDDAVQVTAGREHTCARSTEGRVWCWGLNRERQLGVPTDEVPVRSETPVEVTLPGRAVELASGFQHNCARLASDDLVVWCWGNNAAGQLGDGRAGGGGLPRAVRLPE